MNKYLVLILFILGCGVSPGDAQDHLEQSLDDPSQWCQYEAEEPAETNKSFNHPDGYGVTATYGCFDAATTWPGGYCYIPLSQNQRVKVFTDNQDGTWLSYANNVFGEVRDRMNTMVNWNVVKWAAGMPDPNLEVHTGTTEPNGYLGGSDYLNITTHSDDQGTWRVYSKCKATLYRTSIEANQFYQAASATNKVKYLKNLWDHEINHCLGLPHTQNTVNTLMSVTYFSNGPWFTSNLSPTAAEMDMFFNYAPLN